MQSSGCRSTQETLRRSVPYGKNVSPNFGWAAAQMWLKLIKLLINIYVFHTFVRVHRRGGVQIYSPFFPAVPKIWSNLGFVCLLLQFFGALGACFGFSWAVKCTCAWGLFVERSWYTPWLDLAVCVPCGICVSISAKKIFASNFRCFAIPLQFFGALVLCVGFSWYLFTFWQSMVPIRRDPMCFIKVFR